MIRTGTRPAGCRGRCHVMGPGRRPHGRPPGVSPSLRHCWAWRPCASSGASPTRSTCGTGRSSCYRRRPSERRSPDPHEWPWRCCRSSLQRAASAGSRTRSATAGSWAAVRDVRWQWRPCCRWSWCFAPSPWAPLQLDAREAQEPPSGVMWPTSRSPPPPGHRRRHPRRGRAGRHCRPGRRATPPSRRRSLHWSRPLSQPISRHPWSPLATICR